MIRLQKLLPLALALVLPLAVNAQTISTKAGGGITGVPALNPNTSIGGPEAVVKDAAGNTYIMDNFVSRIFKKDLAGTLTIFAGNGTAGYRAADEGALPTNAQVNNPSDMCIDKNGNIFIADSDNSIIREIPFANGVNYGIPMTAGRIYTVAGVAGVWAYAGDGGPATSAWLNVPDGVSIDGSGNMFIGDRFNHIVRKVTPSGTITTYAGTPGARGFGGDAALATSAKLHDPWGVFVDKNGNLFIADSTNNVIREVPAITTVAPPMTAGNIYTVAGTPPPATAGYSGDNGPATGAKLNTPHGVFVDGSLNLIISDHENHVIREVAGAAATNFGIPMTKGNIYTIAGNGTRGYAGDGGLATAAKLSHASNVLIDGSGNLFIADTDSDALREVPAANIGGMLANHIYTVAGNGHPLWGGDGGPATNGELGLSLTGLPTMLAGVAADGSGSIFIADNNNDVIREVPAVDGNGMTHGNIYTVAGIPNFNGYNSDGVLATNSAVNVPNGVFVDKSSNVFITDTGNCLIREFVVAGNITTVAGKVPPSCGFSGEGLLATNAQLNGPFSAFVDGSGNIFIADTGNHVIREVVAATGIIQTVAGTPQTAGYNVADEGAAATSALLNHPDGIFVDGFGDLFIADTNNHIMREVPALNGNGMKAGSIYTIAGKPGVADWGGDGGVPTAALLSSPSSVYVDPAGDIFIGDSGNNIVREILAATNTIKTVAGTHQIAGFSGDGGPATSALLNAPQGIAFDPSGNLLIADSQNVRIRSVGPGLYGNTGIAISPSSLTFADQTDGTSSAAQAVVVINTGSGPLAISSVALGGANAGDFSKTENCTGAPLAAGARCTINVTFTPTGTATSTRTGTITITDGASTSPQMVNLSGKGLTPVPAASLDKTTLTFSDQLLNTTSAAQTVTLTNTGTGALSITLPIAISGDFAETDNCPASLAVNAQCTINVTFKPTALGTRPGSVTITDNANNVAGSTQTVTLSGKGVAPTADLSGTSLTFSNQLVGTPSGAQAVTLTNNGTAALSIASIALSGTNSADFALTPTNTCGASLAAGANCTISVTFTPSATGSRTALVTITDNANAVPGSTQTISLTGTGVAPGVILSGASLTFATQLVGSTSAAQTITLTNNGTADLGITSIGVNGTNAADFAQTNTCGSTVTAGANCSISVKFTPGANGTRTASVTITDSAAGSPHSVGLTGTGGTPTADLSGTSLTFATQLVGAPSAAQTVKLTNNGTVALSITSIVVGGTNSGDFAQTNTCGASVAVGANCTISVIFTPGAKGSRTASITITDNATPGTQTITLTGTGGIPTADLSGASLTFATQLVGSPSAAQTVTLTNNGNIALGITRIAASGTNSGDFAETDTCGKSLAIGANCTISVVFTPGAVGSRPASITLTDNATGSPQSIALTGNGGIPAASLSAASLTFGNQVVSTPSAAQSVTLTNNGTFALGITSITIGGTNGSDFAASGTCLGLKSLAISANCIISVIFTPGANGSRTASITLTDNATGAPQVITLTGTGVAAAPSVSGSSLSFTTQLVGVSSTAQTVTVTNNGKSSLNITSVAVTGANSGDFAQTNTCGTSVAAGANCTISVTFTPGGSGARAASIAITDNAAGSPHSVSLSGTGMAISLALAANGSNTQTVKAGQTATYSLQLSATGGTATDQASVTISCTGAPPLGACNGPAAAVVVTPAAAAPVSINVTTTGTSMLAPGTQSEPRMQHPTTMPMLPLVVLVLLLCIAALLAGMQGPAGRQRTLRMAFAACLVLLPVSAATLLGGCASGGGSSPAPVLKPSTPAGTYTITVTATASGKAQSTQLTLIVQ